MAHKIDWTTLYIEATPLSDIVSCAANTLTTIQTLTLPAGKWRICWMVRGFYSTSSVATISYGHLYKGSTELQSIAINAISDGAARFQIVGSYSETISASKTYTSRVTPPAAGTVSPTSYLYALRVG